MYSRELQKMLYPDNSFVQKSIAERGVADNVETVEKPVQGSIGKAKEGNPSSLPLQVRNVSDGKKNYPTTLLYCEPILIDSQSQLLTNYNKRATKQEQQANELNDKVAAYTLEHWSPNIATNIVKTTGTARATNVAGMSSQRKAVTKEDFLKLHNLALRQTMGQASAWYGLISPDMLTDLLSIEDFVNYEKTGMTTKLEKGIIGRILNFEIYVRSTEAGHSGVLYDSSNRPLSSDSKITDDVLAGALFWNDRAVCRAEGVVRTQVNEGAPGYLGGTIIESWMRYGADIIRDDQRGVIALLEAK